jgi:hypothetical protein
VAVDAGAEHKHSMNYRPSILAGGTGYRVDSLIATCRGAGRLSIDVRAGEESNA